MSTTEKTAPHRTGDGDLNDDMAALLEECRGRGDDFARQVEDVVLRADRTIINLIKRRLRTTCTEGTDWRAVAARLARGIKAAAHEFHAAEDPGDAYHELYKAVDPRFEVMGRGPFDGDVDTILDRLAALDSESGDG